MLSARFEYRKGKQAYVRRQLVLELSLLRFKCRYTLSLISVFNCSVAIQEHAPDMFSSTDRKNNSRGKGRQLLFQRWQPKNNTQVQVCPKEPLIDDTGANMLCFKFFKLLKTYKIIKKRDALNCS